MSCCGRQRAAMLARQNGEVEISEPVSITYSGARTIVVRGGATGRVYRFVPGGSSWVYGSDAPSMRDIPGLRPRANAQPSGA